MHRIHLWSPRSCTSVATPPRTPRTCTFPVVSCRIFPVSCTLRGLQGLRTAFARRTRIPYIYKHNARRGAFFSVWRGKCITPFLLLCRKTQRSAIVNCEQIENILQTHGKFFIIFRCASAYGIAVDGRKYATGEENMPVFDKKFVVETLVEKVKELPDDLQAEFLAWLGREISAKETL